MCTDCFKQFYVIQFARKIQRPFLKYRRPWDLSRFIFMNLWWCPDGSECDFVIYLLFIYLFIYLCFCYLCFVSKFILKWGGANKTSIIWFYQLSCSEIIELTFWVLALPIVALTNGYRCKRLSNLSTVANSHYQLIW